MAYGIVALFSSSTRFIYHVAGNLRLLWLFVYLIISVASMKIKANSENFHLMVIPAGQDDSEPFWTSGCIYSRQILSNVSFKVCHVDMFSRALYLRRGSVQVFVFV